MRSLRSRAEPALLAAAGAALVAITACGAADEAVPPPVPLSPPVRVVSLAPAASELLLELGAGASLAAVDVESQGIAGLGHLPAVTLADASQLLPDLVLVAGLPGADAQLAEQLRSRGSDVLEVAPHDFDDVFALCRTLGVRLVGTVRASRFEMTIARELASIGGASFGQPRPRVAAVVNTAPLEIAGGHSFTTDLIELAGGSSVTHSNEEPRIAMTSAELRAFAPDLVLVISPQELSEDEQQAARVALSDVPRLAFFVYDPDRFWVHGSSEAAHRLRALVQPLSRELEHRTESP